MKRLKEDKTIMYRKDLNLIGGRCYYLAFREGKEGFIGIGNTIEEAVEDLKLDEKAS